MKNTRLFVFAVLLSMFSESNSMNFGHLYSKPNSYPGTDSQRYYKEQSFLTIADKPTPESKNFNPYALPPEYKHYLPDQRQLDQESSNLLSKIYDALLFVSHKQNKSEKYNRDKQQKLSDILEHIENLTKLIDEKKQVLERLFSDLYSVETNIQQLAKKSEEVKNLSDATEFIIFKKNQKQKEVLQYKQKINGVLTEFCKYRLDYSFSCQEFITYNAGEAFPKFDGSLYFVCQAISDAGSILSERIDKGSWPVYHTLNKDVFITNDIPPVCRKLFKAEIDLINQQTEQGDQQNKLQQFVVENCGDILSAEEGALYKAAIKERQTEIEKITQKRDQASKQVQYLQDELYVLSMKLSIYRAISSAASRH